MGNGAEPNMAQTRALSLIFEFDIRLLINQLLTAISANQVMRISLEA